MLQPSPVNLPQQVGVGTPLATEEAAFLRRAAARFGYAGERLPNVETIRKKKEELSREVQERLRKGKDSLAEQLRNQTDKLHVSANQEKARFKIALDQKVKAEEFSLSQQYNAQLMRLHQTAQAKRAELEQQATNMVLEFQQLKLQEEFLAQQRDIQQQHQDAQQRLAEELQRLLGPGRQGSESGFRSPSLPLQLPGKLYEGISPALSQLHAATGSHVPTVSAAYASPQHLQTPVSVLNYVPPSRAMSFRTLPWSEELRGREMSRAVSWSYINSDPLLLSKTTSFASALMPAGVITASTATDALADVLGTTKRQTLV